MKHFLFLCLAVVVLLPTHAVFAQSESIIGQSESLADVARRANEQRAAIKEAVKSYTNKDVIKEPRFSPLDRGPVGTSGVLSSTPQTAEASAAPVPPYTEEQLRRAEYRQITKKDEAYWKAAMAGLQERLYSDRIRLRDAMALKASQRVWREAPEERVYWSDLLTAIANDELEINRLEEEARHANVPPGWLRPGPR